MCANKEKQNESAICAHNALQFCAVAHKLPFSFILASPENKRLAVEFVKLLSRTQSEK
jgi:hypothetical protein